jgi:hypothetical protein
MICIDDFFFRSTGNRSKYFISSEIFISNNNLLKSFTKIKSKLSYCDFYSPILNKIIKTSGKLKKKLL